MEKYEEKGRYARGRDYDRCNENYTRFNPKLDIPDFEDKMHLDDFLDWLSIVERVFGYGDRLEAKKVKLVAIKLKKHASFWWDNLKRQKEREGKSKIFNWDKMKRELKI